MDVSDADAIDDFVEEAGKETGFTDFYFINREGKYRTVNGNTGYLNLGDELPGLFIDEKDLVVNSVIPGKPQIMIFASYAFPGKYRDFQYEAIAVSFDNSNMINVISTAAYEGNAISYMMHTDGRVIFENAPDSEKEVFNFIAHLKRDSDLETSEVEKIRDDMSRIESGKIHLESNEFL